MGGRDEDAGSPEPDMEPEAVPADFVVRDRGLFADLIHDARQFIIDDIVFFIGNAGAVDVAPQSWTLVVAHDVVADEKIGCVAPLGATRFPFWAEFGPVVVGGEVLDDRYVFAASADALLAVFRAGSLASQ
jgi:hypothetical protein